MLCDTTTVAAAQRGNAGPSEEVVELGELEGVELDAGAEVLGGPAVGKYRCAAACCYTA